MFLIVPKCEECKVSGQHFLPETIRKEGRKKYFTMFDVWMCPICYQVLSVHFRCTNDVKLMSRWDELLKKSKKRKVKKK